MTQIVGTEKDLVNRIRNSKGVLLIRAINDNELDQLLKAGSEAFYFNRRTQYETKYGDMVKMYSKRLNGTVIVYQLQKSDTTAYNEDRRFDIIGWGYCVNSFNGPVEVYNINGLSWSQLQNLRKKETPLDKMVREMQKTLYAKPLLNT